MRIVNTTTIDQELVKEIIRFVRPSGISNFDVMVKNGEYLAGKAYYKGSSYHATADPFVIARVPGKKYPRILKTYQIAHLKGRRYWLADRTEALVYLLAHELRHLWQAKSTTKRWYYPRSRGKFSEIDTESYAITMLRAWRNRIVNNKS